MHNWQDLRYLLEVARVGSFSEASRRLSVNHTTVSRRIKRLEEAVGVKLFIQTGDGLKLTEAAEAVLSLVADVEDTHVRIGRTLSGYSNLLSGDVYLTMPHDLFSLCLADSIVQFKKEFPNIELKLSLTNDVKNLGERDADIAVRLSRRPPGHLVGTQIAEVASAVYGPEHLDDRASVGLVLWEDDPQEPVWAEGRFSKSHCALRVNDLTAMYAAVKAGSGVACLPRYLPRMMADTHRSSSVIRLCDNDPAPGWGLWVLSHVEVRQAARIKQLKHHLVRALEDMKHLFG